MNKTLADPRIGQENGQDLHTFVIFRHLSISCLKCRSAKFACKWSCERTARRVFDDVIATGLPASEIPKGPVSLRLRFGALVVLFPEI